MIIGDPEIAVGVDVKVVESLKWQPVVVIKQRSHLQSVWIDSIQRRSLIVAPIRHDIVQSIVECAPVHVVNGWVGRDLAQLISLRVQEVLPIVRAVVAPRRAPFDEEELLGRRVIARRLVSLEREIV